MAARVLSILLALSVVACATQRRDESSYDKGVEAYTTKDFASARVYWSRAVDEGEVYALNNLGYLLYYGLGGDADPERAVSLWKKGALAGHSEAQWHLGRAFEDGKGTKKDYVEAYAWYRCALASAQAAMKDREPEAKIAEDVKTSIVILVDKLSPEQFERGARLANEYVAKYVKPKKP